MLSLVPTLLLLCILTEDVIAAPVSAPCILPADVPCCLAWIEPSHGALIAAQTVVGEVHLKTRVALSWFLRFNNQDWVRQEDVLPAPPCKPAQEHFSARQYANDKDDKDNDDNDGNDDKQCVTEDREEEDKSARTCGEDTPCGMALSHSFTFSINGLSPGTQKIYLKAQDSAGNRLCETSSEFHTMPQSWNKAPLLFAGGHLDYINAVHAVADQVTPRKLSLERKSVFVGPRVELPGKQRVLVAVFAGARNQSLVDHNLRRFAAADFALMLFIYDDSDWSAFEWFPRATVVRVQGQMKWWYVKRFLLPAVVNGGEYSYLLLLDHDVTLSTDGFDPAGFIALLTSYGVLLAQPAHSPDSQTTHQSLFVEPELIGMWTDFVECGPLVAFHTSIWPCVWDLLQADLVVGYGLDMIWGPLCAPHHTAVIHAYTMKHENTKGASQRPNFWAKSVAEGLVLFDRLYQQGKFPPAVYAKQVPFEPLKPR